MPAWRRPLRGVASNPHLRLPPRRKPSDWQEWGQPRPRRVRVCRGDTAGGSPARRRGVPSGHPESLRPAPGARGAAHPAPARRLPLGREQTRAPLARPQRLCQDWLGAGLRDEVRLLPPLPAPPPPLSSASTLAPSRRCGAQPRAARSPPRLRGGLGTGAPRLRSRWTAATPAPRALGT